MENQELLNKINQVLSKCKNSPIYEDLTYEKTKTDTKTGEVLSERYKVNITNNNILMKAANGNSQKFDYNNLMKVDIVSIKIRNYYTLFNKLRKPRFDYKLILTPMDIKNSHSNGISSVSSRGQKGKDIIFENDKVCEEVHNSLINLYNSSINGKSKNIISALDIIIESDKQAKREIGIENLMEDE